jgi:dipeptidyl aminopeptidase/acylaminoacyl peptidase
VEFLSYPGEQHGFRQPQNRIDAYGRLLKLFDRYLKGAK